MRPTRNGFRTSRYRVREPVSHGFHRPDKERMTVGRIGASVWPTVRVSSKAHGKMLSLVEACPIEIGWLSSCSREGYTFVIDDVYVPAQVCTPVSTRITAGGEDVLLRGLAQSGKIDVIRRLHCWGHSHVEMAVFASPVDENQTAVFLKRREEYFVRLIANKNHDLFCSVYLLQEGLVVHHAPLVVETATSQEWMQWAKDEIAVNVGEEVIGIGHGVGEHIELETLSPKSLKALHEGGWLTDEFHRYLEDERKRLEIERQLKTEDARDV